GCERGRIDVLLEDEALAEAVALELEVAVEELELLPQRLRGTVAAREHGAQEVAEAREHALGPVRVVAQRGRDRVQRVEEEVRRELRLQRAEACLRERALELRPPHGL